MRRLVAYGIIGLFILAPIALAVWLNVTAFADGGLFPRHGTDAQVAATILDLFLASCALAGALFLLISALAWAVEEVRRVR